MVEKLIVRGRKILTSQQTSVLSAASVVMIMIIASRILGLVRQRVLAIFFTPGDLSLFFAAFRLPDIIFEVLVFGTFSSAFIPVFTKSLKKGENEAWDIAGRVVSIGLLIFVVAAGIFAVGAVKIYSVLAAGFAPVDIAKTAFLARILFAAQGFFIVSYVMTGVLESLRRFLIPALAPIFYNLGIILGTVFLSNRFDLAGPAIGVVVGALAHFMIQYPFSRKLGFRFVWKLKPNESVKKIGELAYPRVIDLSFDQVGKSIELYLASFISKASYTYFTFANTLQLLPVSLFGTSLAKAVLPLLSCQEDNKVEFRRILITAVSQAVFLTLPISAVLIVLRIPIIRLVYGTHIFDWLSTVQTGMVLSTFAVGLIFQILMSILTRAFFALRDTKTPVIISFVGLGLLIAGDFILVKIFNMPVWALAASFSFSTLIEATALFVVLNKKIEGLLGKKISLKFAKMLTATLISGLTMFFLLKFFDRSVWVKRLSFLTTIEITKGLNFEKFVLDTRYTINLLVLSGITFFVGVGVYVLICYILKVEELDYLKRLFGKRIFKKPMEPPIDLDII